LVGSAMEKRAAYSLGQFEVGQSLGRAASGSSAGNMEACQRLPNEHFFMNPRLRQMKCRIVGVVQATATDTFFTKLFGRGRRR